MVAGLGHWFSQQWAGARTLRFRHGARAPPHPAPMSEGELGGRGCCAQQALAMLWKHALASEGFTRSLGTLDHVPVGRALRRLLGIQG